VIWNLLSNAVKFTPKNGKVEVVLERVESHVEISVADTGVGIRAAFLPHVFERFRQADTSTTRVFGGLGLGLAIVKNLVEQQGGAVRVKSAGEGQGATFTVSLPLAVVRRATPTARAVEREHGESDLSGVKVLVVDDEPDARDLIGRVLGGCGAEVFSAGSAEEALAVLARERPDVLLSDVGMPKMDGYELMKRVRALDRSRGGRIPAIALTAFARSEDRTRALRAGYLVHLSKPIEPSELAATVASVAGQMRANREE
jgi:CheY-like chemotaxis protein